MSTKPVEIGSLKEGSFVVIDGVPCRVVSMEKSKTGKHGSAKGRVVAVGIFDGIKRNIVAPADQRVDVPIVEKRAAQVISIMPDSVQLMDLESYETFEVKKPKDEEIMAKIAPGAEVEYWDILNEKHIMRVK
ncbi:MAG: translation initiation factor IF-5A [Candidatus Methanosuratincola sp.]|jgi:translation initiation factor 5A|uniref:Translation initiation factor 5A n=2 Tax=Candidatus Methanosuratincola (ex Vanwonterghem et al. 2016) TaxID=1915412 RepID=A0A7J3UYI8_9CREN|nr:translation initiation factor IF-5A [Candidatus Methanosuratincola sp.]RWX73225.1 MAG: Eukaryotic translation initiation factor 5A [Candidatus Methanosuratincola subterraneus]